MFCFCTEQVFFGTCLALLNKLLCNIFLQVVLQSVLIGFGYNCLRLRTKVISIYKLIQYLPQRFHGLSAGLLFKKLYTFLCNFFVIMYFCLKIINVTHKISEGLDNWIHWLNAICIFLLCQTQNYSLLALGSGQCLSVPMFGNHLQFQNIAPKTR